MTENGIWTEEYPAHDLWAVEKSLTPMSPEEEREAWAKTVGILDSLCGMADSLLLDPLILALTDAKGRAEEELSRVEDRLSRPEGAQLHPREEERLRRLLGRDDALGTAHLFVSDAKAIYTDARAHTLAVLEEMHKEVSEQFERYRAEVGLRD
jgi:hypothetical protein